MEIVFRKGNALEPNDDGVSERFILHCCNDVGAWGAGFVVAISKKWPEPERWYRHWKDKGVWSGEHNEKAKFVLGQIQVVPVEERLNIVNIIGQRDIGTKDFLGVRLPPIRYESILEGMCRLRYEFERHEQVSIHMPRMGCGLAGGKWEKIEKCLNIAYKDLDMMVTVYDF